MQLQKEAKRFTANKRKLQEMQRAPHLLIEDYLVRSSSICTEKLNSEMFHAIERTHMETLNALSYKTR